MDDFFAELLRNAKASPHATALISRHGSIDYGALVEAIDNIAAHAAANGLTQGQLVHVESEDDDLRLMMFLGLMRAGLTVPILRSAGIALLETDVIPDAVLTDAANASALAQRARRVIRYSRAWLQTGGQAPSRPSGPSDYGLVFTSSGSTGFPKLILKSADTIDYIVSRNLPIPVYHTRNAYVSFATDFEAGSFTDYLIILMLGGYIIRHGNISPREAVDQLSIYNPSHVRMTPGTLVGILGALDDPPRRFRKVDYTRVMGAYCSIAMRREALDKFANAVFTTYGSTEITTIAWGDFVDIGATEGAVGRIDGDMVVETLDEQGQPLPAGAEGELRIRPPARAVTSYLTREGTRDVLRDGWYYPGDTGRVDPSGQLVITGRKSLVINLGGTKINPEVVENALLAAPGIEDAAVAPFVGEHGYQEICALVVARKPPALDAINRFLAGRGAPFDVKRLKAISEIPRHPNGKIDRKMIRALAIPD